MYKKSSVKKIAFSENTNIFSYYILKSIIMFHINDYMEWMFKNQGDSFAFSMTTKNINEYTDLFIEKKEDYHRIRCCQEMYNWIKKHSNSKQKKSLELKTLRMTLLEI